MKTAQHAFVLAGALALVAGCGKGDGATDRVDVDATGVAECDDYVAKMVACAGKLPEDARPAQEAAIQAARDLLEAKAETDDGKVAVQAACKQLADAVAGRSICGG